MRSIALLAFFLFFTVCLIARPVIPESAAPGEPLVILFPEEDTVQVSVIAETGETVARGTSFLLAQASGIPIQCVITALDSTVAPGRYRLLVTTEEDGLLRETVFTVDPREFREEEIALTQTLTTLRANPDPRKTRESQVLYQTFTGFDPTAIYNTEDFGWPIQLTRRTSLFGDRRTYRYSDGSTASSIHTGLDLASPTGTSVIASGSGIVRLAVYRIVTGNTVVIEHLPGVFSLYYHLDTLDVEERQRVMKGETIGKSGATGLATGPHLHWEFRVGGVAVDPEAMLPGIVPDLLVDFGE